MPSIRMKDRDYQEFGLPVIDIVHNEPEVKERSRQIAFERQRSDAEYILGSVNTDVPETFPAHIQFQ